VNALLAGLVLLWTADRRVAGGVLVALMAAVKPQYGLIVLWGVLRREWSFVAGAVAAGGVILGASVLAFGFASHVNYLEVLAYVSRLGEAYYPNQTLNGLVNRLLQNGAILHWDPHAYPPYRPLVHGLTLLSSVALLGVGLLWPVRSALRGGALDLCAAALAVTMAAPIAWEHHYGLLLPVFAVLLPCALARPVFGRATLPVLAGSYLLASQFLPIANRLAHTPANVLMSGLFVAALCVLVVLLRLLHGADAAPASDAATPATVKPG
jgi:alpha-1,2-mannosyltransferase